jgi:hypothetical protein
MNSRPVRARCRIAVLALVAILGPARTAGAHLLVTEVGYDPVDETSPTAEFVEILNPDPVGVPLASVWLAGDEDAYPYLVNGPVASISSGNFIYRFPDVTLGPGEVAVICQDSDAFLAEYVPGGLAGFLAQPGTPKLFEVTQDGSGDGVPDMVPWGSNPTGTLSMANNGECVGLVTWDGTSDRVADLDWVCWLTTTFIPNKDVDYPLGIDGPDADHEVSFFAEDRANGVPAPDAPQGFSIHRTSLAEPGEVTTGGNGVTGHDETSENWSSWIVADETPGVCTLSNVGVPAPVAHPGLALAPAAPNPSSASVRLGYSLAKDGRVRVTIHDVSGRMIARLVDGFEPAGTHGALWNGCDPTGRPAPAGLYVVRLESGGAVATRRITHLP